MKAQRKSGKYLIKSHINDKALKTIKKESMEAIKRIQHAKDDKGIVEAINNYNLQIVGWHNYYNILMLILTNLTESSGTRFHRVPRYSLADLFICLKCRIFSATESLSIQSALREV